MVEPSIRQLRPVWPEWNNYEFNEATWAILCIQVFTRTWVQRQILQIRPPKGYPPPPLRPSQPVPTSSENLETVEGLLKSMHAQNQKIHHLYEEMNNHQQEREAHQALDLTPTPEWKPFVLNTAPDMDRSSFLFAGEEHLPVDPSDPPGPPKADLLMVILPAIDLQDFYRQSEQFLSLVRGTWRDGGFHAKQGSSFMLHQPQLQLLAGTFVEDPEQFLTWLSGDSRLDYPEASWEPEEVCLAQFREAYKAPREEGQLFRPILMPRFPYPSTSGPETTML